MTTENNRPISHKLPNGMAGVIHTEDVPVRDSAYFSGTDGASNTSAASGIGINIYGPGHTHSGLRVSSDKTPSPGTTGMFNQPSILSPPGNMSINSMVSPTTPESGRFDRPLSYESSGTNGLFDSRRESVDSRFAQGFQDMKLGGNSPYATHNVSTTSIHGSVAHRHPRNSGLEPVNRISNGYQPNAERNIPQNDRDHKTVRTAPVITGPTTGAVARAVEPTKGQAWAFPEEEIQRGTSAAGHHYYDSRRSSITESIASSQYTEASRLPPGQRRFDENPDYRLSNASTDFPVTHHHSLQHKQLTDLHSEESSPQSSSQPYSRTPELRKSHKLAERKRRTEMKELFEQLRDLMPQERGSKASKWEILTKAIAEHQKQADHIRNLSGHQHSTAAENDLLRQEIQRLQSENAQLRGSPNGPPAHQGGYAAQAHPTSDPYGKGAARPELPPLRALSGPISNGDSMMGVQYEGAPQSQSNGYHRAPQFSVRRAALRAASSSSLAAASRQQPGSSFALQFARAAFRPSLVAPTARLFSQTPRRAEEDEEKKAVDDAIKAAESLGSTAPPKAAETAVPAENQSSGIFINNMSFDANEENLREGFAKYGEIVYVNVAKDNRGMSRGFAFVTFDNPASAEAAVAETNQSFWHGRRINVEMRKTVTRDNTRRDRSFGSRDNDNNNNGAAREQRRPFRERSGEPAEPTNSLYIGNIPYEASDAELNRMFRELDNVTDVRVAVDRNTGWPRGFAHADFTDVESAVRAMEKLNSTTLAGRRLRTDYAQGARRNNNNQDRGSRSPRSYEDRGAPAQSGDSSEPASF